MNCMVSCSADTQSGFWCRVVMTVEMLFLFSKAVDYDTVGLFHADPREVAFYFMFFPIRILQGAQKLMKEDISKL